MQIEMIPLTIAEFVDREDKPIYALEQLITVWLYGFGDCVFRCPHDSFRTVRANM